MKLVLHIGKAKKATKSHYWFTLKARNGKILMTSETYKTRRSAVKSLFVIWTDMLHTMAYDETGKRFSP